MPSEKLKYLGNVRPRECLFHESWSDDEGDRSLTISRDGDRLFVRIKREWDGNLEIEMSRAEAGVMFSGLEEFVRPSLEKGPNKAPEPTPGAVMPRAIEGDSR